MYKNVGYVMYTNIERRNLPDENVVVSHSKLGGLSCKKGLICIGQ